MKINKRELRKRRKQADEADLIMEEYGYLTKGYLIVKLPNSLWWWIVKRGKYRHKVISRQPTLNDVAEQLIYLQIIEKNEPIIVHKPLPTRDHPSLASRFLAFCRLPFTSK